MHELQDILQNLHLSEQYVVCLLKKYVVNEDMRKELRKNEFTAITVTRIIDCSWCYVRILRSPVRLQVPSQRTRW